MHPSFLGGRISRQMNVRIQLSTVLTGLALVVGCGREATSITQPPSAPTATAAPTAPMKTAALDPLTLALLPQAGDGHTDQEIRRYQDKVRQNENREVSLERLGWLFIAKARESFDPGYYKLAEACADVLAADNPGGAEARLLHGYVFENLHRFKDAEPIARQLVAERGMVFDYGLLGDSLMEQGRLDEAVSAYQRMVDLRPDLQSYARVAHLRWLKGDPEGAMEMMQAAVSASSPRDPDSAAWVATRLATMEFQAGKRDAAQSAAAMALQVRSNYPPALLLEGRMLLALDKSDAAVEDLEVAAKANPLPEYQWALAEALRGAGREQEAAELEARLQKSGAQNDPRTYSLYLATRGQDPALALRLAEAELQQRADVFTQDALAWALAANGRIAEAQPHMVLALAEKTEDARLFCHAAVIFQRAGQASEAEQWFARAAAAMQSLLPSERKQLLQLADQFPAENQNASNPAVHDASAPGLTAGN
jgi:tetratricopeptide (TPR) repeat protein